MIWYSYAETRPPRKSKLEKYLCVCVIPYAEGGSYEQQIKECWYDGILDQWRIEKEIVVYWTYPLKSPSASFYSMKENVIVDPFALGRRCK